VPFDLSERSTRLLAVLRPVDRGSSD